MQYGLQELNDLQDLTADMISEVCMDTEIEPKLMPLSGEEPKGRTSVNSTQARINIKTRCFWEQEQQAFFDLGLSDPSTCRYCNKSLQQCHVMNEKEKKPAYNERILQRYLYTSQVHLRCKGIFTPVGFLSTVLWEERAKSIMAQIYLKRQTFRSRFQVTGIKKKFCFGLLKSSLLCLRGSRAVCRKTAELEIDVDVSQTVAKHKLDGNHKTNFDTFEFCFCEL